MYRADIFLALEKTAVVAFSALVVALLVWIALSARASARPGTADPVGLATGAAFVFAFLGIVTGLTMGASRVGVVANVLPASLTFIGGLALWIIARETKDGTPVTPAQIVVIGPAVISFMVMLFFGTVLGSYERNRAEFQATLDRIDPDRLRHEAEVEFIVNAYRSALGLPPRSLAH
jgi:hypothetical protein